MSTSNVFLKFLFWAWRCAKEHGHRGCGGKPHIQSLLSGGRRFLLPILEAGPELPGERKRERGATLVRERGWGSE